MSALPALARPFAGLYAGAAALRNALYDAGLFGAHDAGVPVVGLGNLTFGGSGKTPATLWLARALGSKGRAVGVVSRGYGGRRDEDPLVVARGRSILAGARAAGDEPLLVAQAGAAHCVVVGRDRVAAARLARHEGADVVLLDDGFQHRRLARALDIVLVDFASRLGGTPQRLADYLREPVSGLRRAGLVLLTHAPPELARRATFLEGDELPAPVARALSRLAPPPPVAATRHHTVRVVLPDGGAIEPAGLAGRPVLAVSGIARPENFEGALAATGAVVAGRLRFPDHHAYAAADAAEIARQALRTGALVVTTAKDRVRWPEGAAAPAVLEIELRAGAEDAVVERVLAAIGRAN